MVVPDHPGALPGRPVRADGVLDPAPANFQDDRLSVLAGLAKQQIFNREDGRPPPLSPIRRAVSNSTATTAATTAATITATPGRDPYLHPGRQTTVTETRATSWPPMPTIEISFSTSTAQPLTAYNGTRTIAATTFFSTAASAPYLRPGQITSLCFTCSTSTTNPSGFLSPGRVMTTVGVPTTVDGTPTTVQRALRPRQRPRQPCSYAQRPFQPGLPRYPPPW